MLLAAHQRDKWIDVLFTKLILNMAHERHVSWTIFVWAISVIIILIGAVATVATTANNKSDKVIETAQIASKERAVLEGKINVLANDVSWIRGKLEKLDTKSGSQLKSNLLEIVLATTTHGKNTGN